MSRNSRVNAKMCIHPPMYHTDSNGPATSRLERVLQNPVRRHQKHLLNFLTAKIGIFRSMVTCCEDSCRRSCGVAAASLVCSSPSSARMCTRAQSWQTIKRVEHFPIVSQLQGSQIRYVRRMRFGSVEPFPVRHLDKRSAIPCPRTA